MLGKVLCRRVNSRLNVLVPRFRWVQCQLDALERCATDWELKKVLDHLPEGLEEMYEKILEGNRRTKVGRTASAKCPHRSLARGCIGALALSSSCRRILG